MLGPVQGHKVISLRVKSQTLDVRYGSLADITDRSRHVRFSSDSGHSPVQVECPKSAISSSLMNYVARVGVELCRENPGANNACRTDRRFCDDYASYQRCRCR